MYHIFYLWFVIVCRSKESLYDDARLISYHIISYESSLVYYFRKYFLRKYDMILNTKVDSPPLLAYYFIIRRQLLVYHRLPGRLV